MRWIPILFAASLLVGCEGIDTDKANKNVDAANKKLEEGNGLIKEAGKHIDKATKENPAEEAKKCVKKSAEAAEAYEEAAKLTKEASEMKVRKLFGEYLSLKSKAFAKRGEVAGALEKQCKGLVDKGFGDIEAITKNKKKIDELVEEADELDEKAEKIQKDNPDQFKG